MTSFKSIRSEEGYAQTRDNSRDEHSFGFPSYQVMLDQGCRMLHTYSTQNGGSVAGDKWEANL